MSNASASTSNAGAFALLMPDRRLARRASMSTMGETRVRGVPLIRRLYHAPATGPPASGHYDGHVRRTVVPRLVLVSLALAGCDDPAASGPASSSPAILAVDGVDGLPETVAELPAADVEAFRTLLGELRGTPVVVNLWAAWCEPCTREMPRLTAAAAAHTDVQFLGVDTLDSREDAEAFIAEHEVSFPSLFDPDGAIRTDLGSFGLPVTVFFDADGAQVAKVDGELSRRALDEHLATITA